MCRAERSLSDSNNLIATVSSARCEVPAVTTAEGVAEVRSFSTALNTHPDADVDTYSLLLAQRPGAAIPFILGVTEKEELKAIMIGRSEDTIIQAKAGYLPLLRSRVRQMRFFQDGFLGDRSPGVAKAMVLETLKRLKAGPPTGPCWSA
jgi:hypothetical protein